MKFEFEEWPQVHTELEKPIVAYNCSIFDIRYKYMDIFPDFGYSNSSDNEKFYKIRYTLNLLPTVLKDQ